LLPVREGAPDLEMDRAAFGADRSKLLRRLGPASVSEDGYAMARAGANAHYLGPVVARTAAAAESLSRSLVDGRAAAPWFIDVLPQNRDAVRIAQRLGFAPVRHLVRMFRGEPLRGDDTMVYAIAGFEAG
jgi:hypothetical protein